MVVLLIKGNVLFVTGCEAFACNPDASSFSLKGTSKPDLVFPGISVSADLEGEMCIGFGGETDDTSNMLVSLKIRQKTNKQKLHASHKYQNALSIQP